MVDVVVRIDPDKVERNELYEGRVKATCHLDLSVGADRVAYAQLQAKEEKDLTVFRINISAAAAKSSHLDLNTHLYEINGHPTMGGGMTFQIHIAGFLSAASPIETKP